MVLKYVFQQAWERRLMTEASRPVFLWADEAQYFLTGYDRKLTTGAEQPDRDGFSRRRICRIIMRGCAARGT